MIPTVIGAALVAISHTHSLHGIVEDWTLTIDDETTKEHLRAKGITDPQTDGTKIARAVPQIDDITTTVSRSENTLIISLKRKENIFAVFKRVFWDSVMDITPNSTKSH